MPIVKKIQLKWLNITCSVLLILFTTLTMGLNTYFFMWTSNCWNGFTVFLYPICSSTTDFDNYLIFDEEINTWAKKDSGIFPSKLPENTSDFQYEYYYKPFMIYRGCFVRVIWTPDTETFSSEKQRISGLTNLRLLEDGSHYIYYDSNFSIEKHETIEPDVPTYYVDFDSETRTIVYTLCCE